MIATIIGVIAMGLFIFIAWKKRIEIDDSFCISLILLILFAAPLVIGYGDGIKREDKYMVEKLLSQHDPVAYTRAQELNDDLRVGDNYFCRFTLRDESECIDLSLYYEKGENK